VLNSSKMVASMAINLTFLRFAFFTFSAARTRTSRFFSAAIKLISGLRDAV